MDGALQYVENKDKKDDLKNYYSAELRISAINKFIFINQTRKMADITLFEISLDTNNSHIGLAISYRP